METQIHNIPPVFDENSRILILGSFPSVKSRESGFFYGHPRNRFWAVVSSVFGCELPVTVEQKKQMLLSCRVAVWDVLARCDISGSADGSIRNAVPNDVRLILNGADIERIFVNGRTAEKYYEKYLFPVTGIKAVCLPSTSPANAAKGLEELIGQWSVIKN